jgi:hypothetical protein
VDGGGHVWLLLRLLGRLLLLKLKDAAREVRVGGLHPLPPLLEFLEFVKHLVYAYYSAQRQGRQNQPGYLHHNHADHVSINKLDESVSNVRAADAFNFLSANLVNQWKC